MSKFLIINADDFGVSSSVDSAIISLLKQGRISSASLMPNSTLYDEVTEWCRRNRRDIGLHLSLVNDDSKLKHRSISKNKSLENEKGYLFDDIQHFRKSAKVEELKEEIKLQFEKLISSEVRISHVDIHRYAVHPTSNPLLFTYICKQCKRNGNIPIRWCRNGNYNVGEGIPSLCDSDNASRFFAAIADIYGVSIPDYVFKFPYRNTFMDYEKKKTAFINMIRNLPEGISEVHIHPAVETEELKYVNPTWKERVLEYELMMDKEIINEIAASGIKIITYSDIRNIKAKSSKLKAVHNILYYGMKFSLKRIVNLIWRQL